MVRQLIRWLTLRCITKCLPRKVLALEVSHPWVTQRRDQASRAVLSYTIQALRMCVMAVKACQDSPHSLPERNSFCKKSWKLQRPSPCLDASSSSRWPVEWEAPLHLVSSGHQIWERPQPHSMTTACSLKSLTTAEENKTQQFRLIRQPLDRVSMDIGIYHKACASE